MPKRSKNSERTPGEWHEISLHETGGKAVRMHIKQALSEESGYYKMVTEKPCRHVFWARWDPKKKEIIVKATEKQVPDM